MFARSLSLPVSSCIALFLAAAVLVSRAQPAVAPANAQPDAILKIIHPWPDAPADQDHLATNLIRQGFGGVVCNVSFRDYLESEPAWGAFSRAVDAAKKNGMELWLYDESGYPSGTAGHLVLKDHPEWESEGLLANWEQTDGAEITVAVPPGTLMLAAAYPLHGGTIDLSARLDISNSSNSRVTWKPAAPGNWLMLVITRSHLYEGTHAELNLAEKRPYLNLLSPEPTARFIEVTHRRYASHLGTNFPGPFVATFTDEPSLMSLFLRPMPWRPLPWSPAFSAEFQKRRGYAIEPLLPLLLVDGGTNTPKTRYDFWKTVGELVEQNYFGQLRTWCNEHHFHSGGHLLMEEGLTAQVSLYGDFFSCLRALDAPGIDCLTSIPAEVPWQIARQASGAADLNGNTNVMCETSDHSQRYRPAGDTRPVRRVTEAEIRGTCNR